MCISQTPYGPCFAISMGGVPNPTFLGVVGGLCYPLLEDTTLWCLLEAIAPRAVQMQDVIAGAWDGLRHNPGPVHDPADSWV